MIETPFNYTGSKYKLLDQILPHFNYNKPNFVDVFCGGGSVYTNVLDKYENIIINDIISDLIGIHRGLMIDDHIIETTKELCPGKENPPYSNTEAGYNAFWKKDDDLKLYDWLVDNDKNGLSFVVSGTLIHDGKSCVLLDKLISDGYNLVELDFDYNKVSRKGDKITKEILIKNY